MKLIPMYEDSSCWFYCEMASNVILATQTNDLTSATIYQYNDCSLTLQELIDKGDITRVNHETINYL